MSAKKAFLPEPAVVQPLAVDMRRLTRVGARPRFLDYLVQLWDFREFIAYDARARVQSGTRRDRLGSAWLLLNPVFNGLTYYVIFGLLLQTSGGIENYVGYLVIGIFVFQGSAGAITSGARSIHNNKAVIQAFNFPRATLPIGMNLREMMSNVPLIIAMLLIITLIPPVEKITWLWFLIIPALLLQSIFNLGVGFVLARVISKVHDVTHLLPFVMRAWMYGSAIFYSYERFIKHPDILAVMKMNPLFNVIDIIRNCVLYAQAPTWQSWATLAVWALGALIVGIVFFWQGEESYGRG
ncbi:ABC transporter permease [Arthrobacter sp. efr-133-TYG-104]|uniref:ABC transporter permease n=1 Tax=unclassified Arthrobacter TaxID=235627 RepID=UPI00254ECEAD|nr:ABC transporter permease [Arthrobacter sp. efr-133-TYG-104]